MGLGVAPMVVAKIGLDLTQKLSKLFGHQAERVKKRVEEVIAKYNAAVPPVNDPAALAWLYEKSGGLDPRTGKLNLRRIKGWRPDDVPGSNISGAVLASGSLRSLTYEFYAAAAERSGKLVLPRHPFLALENSQFNNFMLPAEVQHAAGQPVPLLAPPPKTQQASLFGLDIGNPGILASLGFLALALILRER